MLAHSAMCPAVLHHTYQISACRLALSVSRDNIPAPEPGHLIPRCHKFENRALVKMKCTMHCGETDSSHSIFSLASSS